MNRCARQGFALQFSNVATEMYYVQLRLVSHYRASEPFRRNSMRL